MKKSNFGKTFKVNETDEVTLTVEQPTNEVPASNEELAENEAAESEKSEETEA